MKTVLSTCYLVAVGALALACNRPAPQHTAGNSAAPTAEPGGLSRKAVDNRQIFVRAIEDAAVPLPSEMRDLQAISDDNPLLVWRDPARKRQLRVASWMTASAAQQTYSPVGKQGQTPTGHPQLWVTLAPEAQRLCQSWGLRDDPLRLRMAQLIGLPPDIDYDTYVELWVDRNDVFRPCADPQADDTRCELSYNWNNPPMVKGIDNYYAFFSRLYEESYRANGAPWTRLGYTYNWGHGNQIYGVSEFMIRPGATYEVVAITPLANYCALGVQ